MTSCSVTQGRIESLESPKKNPASYSREDIEAERKENQLAGRNLTMNFLALSQPIIVVRRSRYKNTCDLERLTSKHFTAELFPPLFFLLQFFVHDQHLASDLGVVFDVPCALQILVCLIVATFV